MESTMFREYSKQLDTLLLIDREVPSMFSCRDFGSPKEVWSLLCSKDEINERDWRKLKKQKYITDVARLLVIDWMMEVCNSLKLYRETFHLAVDYLERYLCVADDEITLDSLQGIGATALLIASKYEEIYPPKVFDFTDFTDGAATTNQVLSNELKMLTKMSWNCFSITVIQWLSIFLQLLAKFNDQRNNNNNAVASGDAKNSSEKNIIIDSITIPKMMRDDFMLLSKVVDLLILDYNFLSFRYREMAAAVIFCFYDPPKVLEEITGIKRSSILKLIKMVEPFVDFCEKNNDNVFFECTAIEGIERDEVHLIQTYEGSNGDIIKQMVEKHKRKERVRMYCS